MAKTSYVKNAALLTATGLVLRVAGMLFRIYLAAQLGSAGMGVYQLIFTVYGLCVTFATAGLSVVATRTCAALLAQQKVGAVRSTMHKLCCVALTLSAACAVLLYFAAPRVTTRWIGDISAFVPLRILAPSLPFMAISACLRGYFMAVRNVRPNACAQLFEQALRIALVMTLLFVARAPTLQTAYRTVVLGNTVSEACSWLMMQLCYSRAVRGLSRTVHSDTVPCGALVRDLAPIAGGQYITGVLRTVENVMVPACLAGFLGNRTMALSQYGALKAMAMPVLFFPFSFIGTLATLLLPEITAAFVRGDTPRLHRLIACVLQITLQLSILAGCLFTVLSRQLGQLLYNSAEVGFYIGVLGPLAPFMYLESMVDGILKGLGEQLATFRYNVIDSGLRIVCIALLLPRWGMGGFLFVMLCSNLYTSLANLLRLLHTTQQPFQWRTWLLWPLGAALGAGGMAAGLARGPLAELPLLPQTLVCATVVLLLYAGILVGSGTAQLKDFLVKKC